ncbi:helix-turn-helix domain-containing protein [Nocardioides sp. QY071]|uniref:helix-turn-helix domain-containing protein n=1 Tax=Nocardioides sp. QY071 TaxID=3044187 RepID=UPI00249C437D|nr:helix-turn-helix domain-containing protein [Nocardioides sp. QY071]WGY02854.1 helix-turn-helix domain-containing protein [Nocardioides sp. QY071]
MEDLWPAPSPTAGQVIRTVCQRLLAESDELAEALTRPALTAQNSDELVADGSLADEDRHISRSDLVQWLTSNIHRPGQRVEPYFDSRTTAYIHDLATRGIAPDYASAWRVALALAWRRWLQECLAQRADPDVLVEVLDVVAQSMVQYAVDWVAAARETRLADEVVDADAEALAMIRMIGSGAPLPQDVAEARLNYRLTRSHTALTLWVAEPARADALEAAVAAVRSTAAGRTALVARASTTARWIWVSGPESGDLNAIEKVLAKAEPVRSAAGRPGHGLDGFRSSHREALAAQAMIIRLGSERRFTAYGDVELIDALTQDRGSAQRFVTSTLGPLADADEALREALLTYVQCGFNTTRAAANLYAHRNTVERRVSRANELSTVKVEDNPTHVAAALLVLEIAPDIVTSTDH